MDKEGRANCEICGAKYSVFVVEHICKRCHRSCCKDCANHKKPIFTKTVMKAEDHRLCNYCWEQSQQISMYIKENGIALGKQSKISREWIDIISINLKKNYLSESSKKIIKIKNIAQIWPNLTESFRELIGKVSPKSQQIMPTVVKLMNAASEKIEANQINSLEYLCIYIACHCTEEAALKVLSIILEILGNFNIDCVCEKINMLCKQKNPSLINYIRNSWIGYAYSFGLLTCKTQITDFLILEVLLAESSEPLESAIAYIIYEQRNIILNDKFDDDRIKQIINRSIKVQDIDKGIKVIRKYLLKKQHEEGKNEHIQEKFEKISQNFPNQSENNIEDLGFEQKIFEAEKYLSKIQKLGNEPPNFQQLQDMEKYLDQIIAENEEALDECEHFDKMLDEIRGQLGNVEN